jgi:gliding motility-associated lipoprotein GldB
MKVVFRVFLLGALLPVLLACNHNRLKVDISGIDRNIEIVHFDKELFDLPKKDTLSELLALREKYPDFFDLFTYKVIRIGGIDDEQFPDLMYRFLTDTMIQHAKQMADKEFSAFEPISKQINKAFKYYQFHFPEKEIPTVFTCISGFNQSVFTAENIIGISLDKYLGRDCTYYRQLSTTPQYKVMNMYKEKIVSDVAYAWGITEFEETNKAINLLGNMIHQGKLMYFVDALLPEMNDSLKIGYTGEQLEWCKKNESQMWLTLVEKKMLYSSKRMDIIRYINDAPYTNGFPLESPGRTGIWIGWQIVRQYMKKHPEVTLPQLMQNSDYQGILNASGYFPE